MLFPGGLLIQGKQEILKSLTGQSWESHRIDRPQVINISEKVATVVYKVNARRAGCDEYIALISSTYALTEDGWTLVIHQQTPE
jgi:hypothetical protein